MARWESTPDRIWKDTKAWLQSHIVAWFLAFLFPGAGTMLATLFIPANTSLGMAGLYGFLGGVAGLLLLLLVVYLYHLFITPYRQRNELRKRIERLAPSSDSKYYDQRAEDAFNRHCEDLIATSKIVVSRLYIPSFIDNRYITHSSKIDEELDGIQAIMYCISSFEIEDMERRREARVDLSLYDYLQVHLTAEDPEWGSKMAKLRNATVILHSKLYAVTQVAMDISKRWEIALESDWSTTEGVFNVHNAKLSRHLRKAIKPMQNEVMQAYKDCEEAIEPIREKLHTLIKRRAFKGKCPACPDYSTDNTNKRGNV